MLFEGWQGDQQGTIHCDACFHREAADDCPVCKRQRVVILEGSYEQHLEGDSTDVFRAATTIVQSAQHEFPRSATDWLSQPAKWIDAYEFLVPFAAVELEAKRKRDEFECPQRS